MTKGHVFVTRGDITRLACDAWLLPTDEDRWIPMESFVQHDDALRGHWRGSILDVPVPPAWGADAVRTTRIDLGRTHSVPWLTITGDERRSPAWHAQGIQTFLESAFDPTAIPANKRVCPLFAVPLVGTGAGGAANRRGEMATAVLQVLNTFTEQHEADVALVLWDDKDFASVQDVRAKTSTGHFDRALSDSTIAKAEQLAELARDRDLVVFLGAGIGAGAGLPDWKGLLDRLAATSGIKGKAKRALDTLEPVDRAHIIEAKLQPAQRPLGKAIAREVSGASRYALAHTLVATLPVKEFVTTNYDELLEFAASDVGRPVAKLPYEAARSQSRWLLKLHGCVTRPGGIVLTRDDYLSFQKHRAALSSIVQALLITRHMLFLGFSLRDDSFHRIAHEVRDVVRNFSVDSSQPFGTTLALASQPLIEELWADDLEFVNFDCSDDPSSQAIAAQARRLEIFLDLLLFHATDHHAFLLDPNYSAQLDDREQTLQEALMALTELDDATLAVDVAKPVREMLAKLGYGSESTAARRR